MSRRHVLVVAGTVAALVVGVGGTQLLPGAAPTASAKALTGYAGCDQLLAYYRAELKRTATAYGMGFGYGAEDTAAAGAPTAARSAAGQDAVGSGATGTNIQEQGVDEPDLAKLKDGRLVVLTGNRVQDPERERPARGARLDAHRRRPGVRRGAAARRQPRGRVVPGWRADPSQRNNSSSGVTDSRLYLPGTPTTRVLLLDVSTDRPRLIEDATYDAQYVSARLVDGTVRLVTTTRPQPPVYFPNGPAMSERKALATNRRLAGKVKLAEVLPQVVRKSANGKVLERGNAVSCTDTFHARTPYGVSTLLVTTLRPADGLAATDSTAVTTDGDLVYASADRLYVATSRWGTVGPVMPMLRSGSAAGRPAPDEVSTELHAFDTSSSTKTEYVGSGSVPGFVLGRWALSQHEGALRVATTRQPPWDGEQTGKTSSMVVKLEERDGCWSRPDGSAASARPSRSRRSATSATSRRS